VHPRTFFVASEQFHRSRRGRRQLAQLKPDPARIVPRARREAAATATQSRVVWVAHLRIRSAEHLRESILDPDASVSPEFWVAKIVLKDGSSHSGFVMNQDTYMVQILDFSTGLQSLSRSDFKDFGIDRSSIMPSYKGKLSEGELDDLVNYLLSLKRQPARSE